MQPTTIHRPHRRQGDLAAKTLREALAPYIDLKQLRTLVAIPESELQHALNDPTTIPLELEAMLHALRAILRPSPRERIRAPQDLAALLMVDMGHIDHEELRVICLDQKNRVQKIVTLYQGNVHSAIIRVAEVFKDALRINSPAIVIAHNHPSQASAEPSPQDVQITCQIAEAGKLLDCQLLDHLIISRGRWVSLRERGFLSASAEVR